jgi:hypothetical protein
MTATKSTLWRIIKTENKYFAGFSAVQTKIFKYRHGIAPYLMTLKKIFLLTKRIKGGCFS